MALFTKQLWEMVKGSQNVINAIKIFTTDDDFDLGAMVEYLSQFNEQSDPYVLLNRIEALDLSVAKDGIPVGQGFDLGLFLETFKIYDFKTEKKMMVFDENGIPLLTDKVIIKADDFRAKASFVDAISTYLYWAWGFFKPIVPSQDFNLFRKNCDILGIELPEPPHTKDYSEYLIFFVEICEAIQKWQDSFGLSDAEACACIYELAPALSQGEEHENELPKPTNVWLTGASKWDIKMLEEKNMNYKSIWACNERTRRGDIVVLFALAPYSCIHSIWRAETGGFFNPFDHYHNRTTVVNGIKVPKVSFKELKDDPVFGALPMMRNNLQGINGKELPATAYDALLRIIEKKGADMTKIPVLYETKDWNPGEIKLEKDVEEKILIPVLKDLGYSESDWTRQLDLQAGRGLKAIPDFVFYASGDEHHEVAPFVIEAKKNMASNLQRRKDFNQGVSYAKMLSATILGMCDEERIVIYKRSKDGKFNYDEQIFEHHWAEINGDLETFAKLKKLIGPNAIKDLIH